MIGFRIGHGEFASHVRLQRTLRKVAAETLQHDDGSVPLLPGDQQGSGIEVGVGSHLRRGRFFRYP